MDRSLYTKQLPRLRSQSLLGPSTLVLSILAASSTPSTSWIKREPCRRPCQRRTIHTHRKISSSSYELPANAHFEVTPSEAPSSRPLSCLSLTTLIRSYAITSVSSIPFLLRPSLAALAFLAHTKSPIFSPNYNPVLHFLLKRTFYAQFCAGETPEEVRRTIDDLKETGYNGVILGHAKEVVLTKEDAAGLDSSADQGHQAQINARDIGQWKQNTIDTIDLAQEGDFVALKFTGAGRQALRHLKATIPCAPEFEQAVHAMCKRAQRKGVKLLFDAEQASLQEGIDNWTMYFAKIYNKDEALVFGTYQAYAKKTPGVLARHLAVALDNDFVLGVKLVRGAYLGSDPRELFWPSAEETHSCYNGLAKGVMERKYNDRLQPLNEGATEFPRVSLVLATHNSESVRLARELRDLQATNGEEQIEVAYGQLMGMADNVSCAVVQTARERRGSVQASNVEIPRAYKYLVWGQLGECMKYLLRRAQENKDAVSRTVEARRALGQELGIRLQFWRR